MAEPLPARIEPVPPDERVGIVRDLLDQARIGTGSDANIFATLVRAPGLFRRWLPFGGKLLNGNIPARDRELVILRTAWNCRAEYEWAQHARIAQGCGLAAQADLQRNTERAAYLTLSANIANAMIAQAAYRAEIEATEQLIELTMLIGHYHLVAMTLNGLRVQVDEGLTGFPQ